MTRGSKYVKPTKRTTAPIRMICAVPEISDKVHYSGCDDLYYQARAVWYIYSRRYGDRWYGDDEPTRVHPDDFWTYVDTMAVARSRLYIVSPSAADLCTLTGFWRHLDSGHYSLSADDVSKPIPDDVKRKPCQGWQGRLVMSGPPDIIHVRYNNASICQVSLRNYTDAGWDRIASASGYVWERRGCDGIGGEVYGPDPHDCVCILTRYIRAIIAAWVRGKMGVWKDTTAQLSLSLWRQRFYTCKVCRHEDDNAIALENAAMYGGRAQVFYFGDVYGTEGEIQEPEYRPTPAQYYENTGWVYRCDVSSQYPAILAEQPFPIRLLGVTGEVSVADLVAMMKYYEVIANVTIRTERSEWPMRADGHTDIPTGKFTTTLAGPDIQAVLRHAYCIRVNAVARYERGYPLRDYARWLITERDSAKSTGDYCGELLFKTLANSIGGKFAQRYTKRIRDDEAINPGGRWGPWNQIVNGTSLASYVSIAGISYRLEPGQTGSRLLSAVYCYLTAYGRMQMMNIRDSLPPYSVYAQDTDGIWVSEIGYQALTRQGMSAHRIAGKLREVSKHAYARWFTPKHYYIDGRWVLSGYRYGFHVESNDTVVEYREDNPIRHLPWKPPMSIRHKQIRRNLCKIPSHIRIGRDGWWIPTQAKL